MQCLPRPLLQARQRSYTALAPFNVRCYSNSDQRTAKKQQNFWSSRTNRPYGTRYRECVPSTASLAKIAALRSANRLQPLQQKPR